MFRSLLLLSALAFAAPTPRGEELQVLAAGASKAAVTELSATYGPRVRLTFDTVGGILKRLSSGENPDLIIVTAEAARELERDGKLAAGTKVDLGQVRIGVGIKKGAAAPDISTVEALKKTLLSAKSVSYTDPAKGATSGIHFAKVLDKLGIAEPVKAKTVLASSGSSAEKVASGEAELCVQQVTEILPFKGVTLVGLLPEELQKTTTYTAGIAAGAAHPAEAKAFLKHLTGPNGRKQFIQAGFTKPG